MRSCSNCAWWDAIDPKQVLPIAGGWCNVLTFKPGLGKLYLEEAGIKTDEEDLCRLHQTEREHKQWLVAMDPPQALKLPMPGAFDATT